MAKRKAKYRIDGYKFDVFDKDLNICFDVDIRSGLVEITVDDNSGGTNTMYVKREVATVLSLWLKSRLS